MLDDGVALDTQDNDGVWPHPYCPPHIATEETLTGTLGLPKLLPMELRLQPGEKKLS